MLEEERKYKTKKLEEFKAKHKENQEKLDELQKELENYVNDKKGFKKISLITFPSAAFWIAAAVGAAFLPILPPLIPVFCALFGSFGAFSAGYGIYHVAEKQKVIKEYNQCIKEISEKISTLAAQQKDYSRMIEKYEKELNYSERFDRVVQAAKEIEAKQQINTNETAFEL